MSDGFLNLPYLNWRPPVATSSALPATSNQVGDAIVTDDTLVIYLWSGSAWVPVTSGGTPGTVTNVTASSPLASSGGSTPNISISSSTGSGAVVLASSPALVGIPTAPTASVGTSTTQLATTAFVLSQGFLTSSGSVPTGEADNATAQTSATTTFVNALTTTVTLTQTAQIHAVANATFTTTTAASVAGLRVTINAVASRTALITLTALATDYMGTVQYLSAALAPGTYTVNFDFQRSSGTGTVNYVSGTLVATGLQGTNSNGITQLTGALQAGPGSGSLALTGVLPVANGGTHLSSTTINQLLYSSANNVIAGLATANTGALVTSSTGVPSLVSGATANRVLRTNGTTVSFAQLVLTTDVSGILPAANGGTGSTALALGRIPFSDGTKFIADALFQYTTSNTRFIVGQGGGTGRVNGTVSLTDPSPNDLAGNFFSRTTANNCVNIQNENTLFTLDMTNSGGPTLGTSILAEASRGTLPARTQSQAGDALFTLIAHGRTASAWSSGFSASLQIVTAETVTDTTNGGEMVFSTTPIGGAAVVERLRIKNSGESVFASAIALARMSTATKNALTPVGGWVVFDTDLSKLSYYNGITWVNL